MTRTVGSTGRCPSSPDTDARARKPRRTYARPMEQRGTDQSAFSIRLFGDVTIELDEQRVTPPGKALELLGYLLTHRERTHSRESVAELLWPGAAPGAARKYLRQALWRLNAMTGDGYHPAHSTALVAADGSWIAIDPSADYWLDVEVFEGRCAEAGRTPADRLSAGQFRDLESAVALYRGDFAASWYHEWCVQVRDRLRKTYLTMLDQLIAHCLATSRYAQGISLGRRSLSCDPARESTHRSLVQLYAADGDRTAALRQYKWCVQELDREFGVPPGVDLRELVDRIRADRGPGTGSTTHRPVARAAAPQCPVDSGRDSSLKHLLALLTRFDTLLRQQIELTEPDADAEWSPSRRSTLEVLFDDPPAPWTTGPRPLDDGMAHLTEANTRQAPDRAEPAMPLRLETLAEVFDLQRLDLAVIIMTLAPEVDRRYAGIYGRLLGDDGRRQPTVDLALSILCPDLPSRIGALTRFTASAPLVRHQLITVAEDPLGPPGRPPARSIALDPRIIGFLLGDDAESPQLRPYVRLVRPPATLASPDSGGAPAVQGGDIRLPGTRRTTGRPDLLYYHGSDPDGPRRAALAQARRGCARVLVVSADRLADNPDTEFTAMVSIILREALLQGSVMVWENADALFGAAARQRLSALLRALAAHPEPVFLTGAARWQPTDLPPGLTLAQHEISDEADHIDRVPRGQPCLGGDPAPVETPRQTPGQTGRE